MKCPLCNSDLKEDTVEIRRTLNGKPLLLKAVPAKVCIGDLCGQVLLHSNIVEKIKLVIRKMRLLSFTETVYVFDFSLVDSFIEVS